MQSVPPRFPMDAALAAKFGPAVGRRIETITRPFGAPNRIPLRRPASGGCGRMLHPLHGRGVLP